MSDGLEVVDLSVAFGGNMAVGNVSLAAPTARLTGLIGPNGAGKTTTFNACSGLLRPTEGGIVFHGVDVTRLNPASRARRGLGRTFQRMELFLSLTVHENVALGREAGLAGANAARQVFGRRGDRAMVIEAADAALDRCGIAHLRDVAVANLSTGQRRLVELARVLAGGFRVLLLDEPSSGLDHDETAAFGSVLRSVIDEQGTGILLVEHDMSLVMEVCDYVYVLDFGQLIFEGTASEVASSEIVRTAYLGTVAF